MSVIYRHKQSKAERVFGGLIARLERSDEWERIEDNDVQPLVVKVAGDDELGIVRTSDDADVPGTDPADVDLEAGDPADAGEPFPRHKGGGNYELSDGNTVKGKDAAEAAQAELDEQ